MEEPLPRYNEVRGKRKGFDTHRYLAYLLKSTGDMLPTEYIYFVQKEVHKNIAESMGIRFRDFKKLLENEMWIRNHFDDPEIVYFLYDPKGWLDKHEYRKKRLFFGQEYYSNQLIYSLENLLERITQKITGVN